MKVTELNAKHNGYGRQMGNRLVYVNGDKVYGYTIATYNSDYEPTEVYNDMEKVAPTAEGMTWDMAHDALFGAPEKPRFGNNLINE